MKYLWIEKEIFYDGSQLRSHWIREMTGSGGDAIVAFIGGCEVTEKHMVDLEDREKGAFIKSARMLHFIIEMFGYSLREISLLQRLFISILVEELRGHIPHITRNGDDIFTLQGKLSVSIATVSPVSGLIHTGININPEGSPVQAASLPESLDPRQFAEKVAKKLIEEVAGVEKALRKVKWVP